LLRFIRVTKTHESPSYYPKSLIRTTRELITLLFENKQEAIEFIERQKDIDIELIQMFEIKKADNVF